MKVYYYLLQNFRISEMQIWTRALVIWSTQ
jgi:hypothetical protein